VRGRRAPAVVVGAGLSGLTCALDLQRRGIDVRIVEASDDVGGRVRSDRVEGFTLDRGFQVLLTAYPEVRRNLDLDALELGRFEPGALVRRGGRFVRVFDPLRRPREAFPTLRSGVANAGDVLRLGRMAWETRGATGHARTPDGHSALAALRERGFSDALVEGFFRPFLGGVFLDPELRPSSASLDFLFRMFATGDAALPAAGMGAVAAQLAAGLAPGTLRLRAPVSRVERFGVVLDTGERVAASAVVVATEADAAAKLLPGLAVPESRRAISLHFEAPRAPVAGPVLVLDGEASGPVNQLCVPSAVAPRYAPSGRAVVHACVLEPDDDEDEALELAVRRQLGVWFGADVEAWRLLRIDRVAGALPSQPPGAFEPRARRCRLVDHLFVCGDHRDLASLQGAMHSGRRAADEVCRELRA